MNAPIHSILLVEDDENDVFLMKRAMFKANLQTPMQVTDNGRDAIDYLAGTGKFADRTAFPLPDCIFLDLKLPFVHGFEVLEWLRAQPALAQLPVFVLTSSPEDRDRQRAEQLGAKAYLLKPPSAQALLGLLQPRESGFTEQSKNIGSQPNVGSSG
jgi:CheY-like chemotaxis protein